MGEMFEAIKGLGKDQAPDYKNLRAKLFEMEKLFAYQNRTKWVKIPDQAKDE
jgi:hypothetical protein